MGITLKTQYGDTEFRAYPGVSFYGRQVDLTSRYFKSGIESTLTSDISKIRQCNEFRAYIYNDITINRKTYERGMEISVKVWEDRINIFYRPTNYYLGGHFTDAAYKKLRAELDESIKSYIELYIDDLRQEAYNEYIREREIDLKTCEKNLAYFRDALEGIRSDEKRR